MHAGLIRHLIFAFCAAAHTVELFDPHVAFGRHIVMIAYQIIQGLHFACHFTLGQPLGDGQASLQTCAISEGSPSPRSSSCWCWRHNQHIVAD